MNDIAPLVLFTLATASTPGPNNFMIMNSGMHFGIKRSLPHYFGIALGFPLMFLVLALGLGAVFTQYVWIRHVLKIMGTIYMLYMAWQILVATNKDTAEHVRKPLTFLQAMLFQWVNPKAWIMAIGAISLFTLSDNYYLNAVMISVICFFGCLPFTIMWLLFGKALQHLLKKNSHRIWFNIVMALALVASIGMIIFD